MSSVAASPSAGELFSPALIAKYDLNGPRYTSYPTAAQFTEAFTAADYAEDARASNLRGTPLSLYVHIPFCATVCYYCACNRVITRNRAHASAYLGHLEREAALQSALYDGAREVRQMHWGGGTPTFLDFAQTEQLMGLIRRNFRCATDDEREFSIEIDPRACPAGTMQHLRDLGFNRVSFGVQDFDPQVQVAVNRLQSQAVTISAVQAARKAGFGSISLDLIYGLPLQTQASFARTLAEVIAIRPERLSVFNYAHLPHMFKTQRQIDAATLPTASEKLAILDDAIALLSLAGYEYIGMDHFALPQDELARAQRAGTLHRNFQGYTTHAGCDLVALGASSIGMLDGCYSQNAKELDDYYARIDREELAVVRGVRLNDDDRLRRAVIGRLICAQDVDIPAVEREFGITFAEYFAPALERLAGMADDGLVEMSPSRIRVESRGRLFLRQICLAFDRYAPTAGTQRFSRAI